jgi:hypothetical protein
VESFQDKLRRLRGIPSDPCVYCGEVVAAADRPFHGLQAHLECAKNRALAGGFPYTPVSDVRPSPQPRPSPPDLPFVVQKAVKLAADGHSVMVVGLPQATKEAFVFIRKHVPVCRAVRGTPPIYFLEVGRHGGTMTLLGRGDFEEVVRGARNDLQLRPRCVVVLPWPGPDGANLEMAVQRKLHYLSIPVYAAGGWDPLGWAP